jgi:hypothetical protein
MRSASGSIRSSPSNDREDSADLMNWARPPIRARRARLDRGRRQRSLRHAFDAPHQSDADLPQDRQLRAVQLLLGHTKIESTVRYLGIEVDDALSLSEQVEL